MKHNNWQCPKCQNKEFEADHFAATGGGFSRFLNLQNKKFATVSCTKCKYTEIYKADTSALSKFFDLLGG